MTVTSSVDVNKLVCHYEENTAQLNAARTQAENSREPQKSLRLSKKSPKRRRSAFEPQHAQRCITSACFRAFKAPPCHISPIPLIDVFHTPHHVPSSGRHTQLQPLLAS